MATHSHAFTDSININHLSPVIFSKTAEWDGVRVRHSRLRRSGTYEHCHTEAQIAIPLEGSFSARMQLTPGHWRTVVRTVGHTSIVPSGLAYQVSFDEEMEFVSIFLDPALLARIASNSFAPGRVELVDSCDASDPLIRQIGLALMTEAESERPADRLYVDSLTHALVVHLLRHYATDGERLPPSYGGLARHKLRRATEFITDNLESELKLGEIAGEVGLSPYHFARAFKQTTGMTPHQYLIKSRIERAKSLLTRSELPIVEVGYRAGFKSQSHFTTVFRRLTSMTPGAYRDIVRR